VASRGAPHLLTSCYSPLAYPSLLMATRIHKRVLGVLHPRARLASTFQHPTFAQGISLGMYRHWFGVPHGISAKEVVLYSTTLRDVKSHTILMKQGYYGHDQLLYSAVLRPTISRPGLWSCRLRNWALAAIAGGGGEFCYGLNGSGATRDPVCPRIRSLLFLCKVAGLKRVVSTSTTTL
jgi:hypothetical protein